MKLNLTFSESSSRFSNAEVAALFMITFTITPLHPSGARDMWLGNRISYVSESRGWEKAARFVPLCRPTCWHFPFPVAVKCIFQNCSRAFKLFMKVPSFPLEDHKVWRAVNDHKKWYISIAAEIMWSSCCRRVFLSTVVSNGSPIAHREAIHYLINHLDDFAGHFWSLFVSDSESCWFIYPFEF